MSGLWLWLAAAALYAGFRLWYDGRRAPLSRDEIEGYLKELAASAEARGMHEPRTDAEAVRRFLEADDGREFVMVNLVRLHSEPVPHPTTGEPTPARKLLRGYLRGFLPAFLRRGGLPVLQGRKVGGYVDAWNTEPDPGWTLVGAMRYRSRRDMMDLATDPRFTDAHPFKKAAMPVTFSFPSQLGVAAYVGPRIWLALLLALAAALGHLALVTGS